MTASGFIDVIVFNNSCTLIPFRAVTTQQYNYYQCKQHVQLIILRILIHRTDLANMAANDIIKQKSLIQFLF